MLQKNRCFGVDFRGMAGLGVTLLLIVYLPYAGWLAGLWCWGGVEEEHRSQNCPGESQAVEGMAGLFGAKAEASPAATAISRINRQ
jgi:hypothetical protein